MLPHNNPQDGYLSKDDLIRSMAAEIEYLRKELHVAREMKMRYLDDCMKQADDNIRLRNHLHTQAQMMHGPYATWHDPEERNR